MSVTLKEIANRAGVSRATVDKVIHNRPGLKEETRQKVQKILDEAHYKPNVAGKALVLSRAPIRIAIVVTPKQNPYIQEVLKGVERANREYASFGIETIVCPMKTLSSGEVISILNDLERVNISGVALFPIDDPEVTQKANELVNRGISVLTWNSEMEDIKSFVFIGQDHYKAGEVAGGLIKKLLPEGGNICIITSTKNLSCHQKRLGGFKKAISSGSSPYRIMDIQENEDISEEAYNITNYFCDRYEKINAIYMTSSGIEGAVKALDKNGYEGVHLICHDVTPESVKLLKEEKIDFVLSQNAEEQGYALVKTLFEHLVEKKTPKDHFVKVPITIVTKELL